MSAPEANDGRPLWHNTAIDKSEPYVGELLLTHLRQGPVDLKGAHLVGIRLPDADLAGIDLSHADLRDAQLPGAVLRGAKLTGCRLRRVNLAGADLAGASLAGSDLTGAHLGSARLSDADLRGCRLEDTVLLGADLEGANLDGCDIRSFSWNRLTRFGGVRSGQEGDAGDGDATARFALPLALGEHDLSRSRRSSVTTSLDDELTATRFYRADLPGSDVPTEPSAPGGTTSVPVAVAMPAWRRPWLAAASGLLGLGLGGGLVWSLLPRQTAPAPLVIIKEPVPPVIAPAALDSEQERTYRKRIADLTAAVSAAEQRAQSAQARRDGLDSEYRALQLRAAWLENRLDGDDGRRRELDRMRDELAAATVRNRRLEDTARVLADGVKELEQAKTELDGRVYRQVQDQHRLEQFEADGKRLATELELTKQRLADAQSHNAQLDRDTKEALAALDTVDRRLQGTGLDDLLREEPQDAPLVQVIPGQPLTFGGDYLVSLRLNRGRRSDTVAVELVVQAPAGRAIPELGLILYGDAGKPLRKLVLSTPGGTAVGSGGFSALNAEVSCPTFPSAVRLLLAPGLGAGAVAQAQP